MVTMKYAYPDDPITDVRFMFGIEFAAANPNREIVIGGMTADGSFDDANATRIPVAEIVCDTCNALVQDVDPIAITLDRLYCWPCTVKWILPYVRKA